jgi:hypothetical protein
MFRSRVRARHFRLRTTSCWRETRVSASSLARDLSSEPKTSRNRLRNATITRLVAHPQGLVTPEEVFGRTTRPASGSPLRNAATACRSYRIDRCPERSNTIRTISMIPTIPIPPAGP